jgi:hypothetical protein
MTGQPPLIWDTSIRNKKSHEVRQISYLRAFMAFFFAQGPKGVGTCRSGPIFFKTE